MKPNLIPEEPLSQVTFIHDYIQLVFQDEAFSIYNRARVDKKEGSISRGAPTFCDALVGLIGERVVSVSTDDAGCALSLGFEGGSKVRVLSGPSDCKGPEAFQFNGPNDLVVVHQNS